MLHKSLNALFGSLISLVSIKAFLEDAPISVILAHLEKDFLMIIHGKVEVKLTHENNLTFHLSQASGKIISYHTVNFLVNLHQNILSEN